MKGYQKYLKPASIILLFFLQLTFTNAFDLLDTNNTIKTINKELEDYKNSIKEKIMKNAAKCHINVPLFRNLRSIDSRDDPDEFFCSRYEDRLSNLPIHGMADIMPWSGYYWPIRTGLISLRYGLNEKNSMREYNATTGSLVRSFTYEESITKYKQPEEHNRIIGDPSINLEHYINEYYSPSEKYDFLIGDYNYTLTNVMKAQGYYVRRDPDGDVAVWMGICHGWSPASYKEKRPNRTVSVLASDGKTHIEFLPDDIKALVTLYWAEAKYATKFIGGRCKYENLTNIPSDPETGLWEDNSCFSLNPASVTIAMANQIGIRKKNLNFDPESNGEIWNQPAYSYDMSFFNILTTQEGELSHVKVSVQQVDSKKKVKLLKYIMRKRNEQTEFFVGVKLTVHFVFEIGPVHVEKNRDNRKSSQTYNYILELDEYDKIIGGEWTHNNHPTFIWMPDEHARIESSEDEMVRHFDGSVRELENIKDIAIKASGKKTVIKAVVDYLLNQS